MVELLRILIWIGNCKWDRWVLVFVVFFLWGNLGEDGILLMMWMFWVLIFIVGYGLWLSCFRCYDGWCYDGWCYEVLGKLVGGILVIWKVKMWRWLVYLRIVDYCVDNRIGDGVWRCKVKCIIENLWDLIVVWGVVLWWFVLWGIVLWWVVLGWVVFRFVFCCVFGGIFFFVFIVCVVWFFVCGCICFVRFVLVVGLIEIVFFEYYCSVGFE